ncbi:MAG: SDR family NAD(P)-dependent oxidoreductase [Clostridiales bacterium]|nr:SDR family NAD(P)-dependent oxidoreductase [Clostridiales bacterium]
MRFVVIGATKGLGLCLTEQLLAAGHRVAAGAIVTSDALRALAEQYPGDLLVLPADVGNEEQMRSVALASRDFLGEIDAVCNVAGVLLSGDRTLPLHQCDTGELRRTLDVNTVGPVIVAKCFYPHMPKGARLFTVTSEGVAIGSCGTWVPCYALSKAAATKACGILNASAPDVDFYAVHPGRMNTDMGRTTAQIEPETSASGFCRLLTGQTPISRDCWYIDYLGRPMPL